MSVQPRILLQAANALLLKVNQIGSISEAQHEAHIAHSMQFTALQAVTAYLDSHADGWGVMAKSS